MWALTGALSSGTVSGNVPYLDRSGWKDVTSGSNGSCNGDTGAGEPRSVRVGTDRYAVLFTVKQGSAYHLEYRLIGSASAVLASKSFPNMFYASVCDPVLVGHTIFWVSNQPLSPDDDVDATSDAYFYGINVTDPTAPVLGK